MSADLARRAGALLLALFLLALVSFAWTAAGAAPWLRAMIAGAALLAAARPYDALLVLAGLGPVIGIFGAARGAPLPARDALVLACFTGWTLRLALQRQRTRILPADLAAPFIVFTIVVLGSAAVELWGQRELLGPAEFGMRIRYTLGFGPLQDRAALRGLNAALVHLEGLAIFAVVLRAATIRRDMPYRVALMAAAGAAGAAALNTLRLVNAAVASDSPLERIRQILGTVRINVHFSDVNAAGSYFALTFFPAVSAAIAGRGVPRIAWGLAAAIVFAAAWLTGSRAAVAAILVVVILSLSLAIWPRRNTSTEAQAQRRTSVRRVGMWLAFAVCVVVVLAFVTLFPNRVFGSALSTAVWIRVVMAQVTFRMVSASPVFGVGIGGYYDSSAPLLLTSPLAGIYARENAHNNLLQLLGELGIVGFAAFVWLLWRVARRMLNAKSERSGVMPWGIVAAIVAFGLTTLLGHPLLTPEVNHAFWLMLGAAAGLYDDSQNPPARYPRTVVVWFAALMVATLPWRIRNEVAGLDLEHVRYGTSPWISAPNDLRYQMFSERATLFAARDVAAVRIPLREPSAPPGAAVDILLEGRLVDRAATGPEWRYVRILTGEIRSGDNFRRIDLVVTPNTGTRREVHVGRLELIHK